MLRIQRGSVTLQYLPSLSSRLGKNPDVADCVNECTIRYDESHVQDWH